MTDESAPAPQPAPHTGAAPRGRRGSNKRPAKPAKTAQPTAEPPAADMPEPTVAANERPAVAESAVAEPANPPENPKRKRRRKKGKGHAPHPAATPAADEDPATPPPAEPAAAVVTPPARPPKAAAPRPERPPNPNIDPGLLDERAWKIYLAEISEEGVALVGDPEARELARRCFRLAEIFLEEQARRH